MPPSVNGLSTEATPGVEDNCWPIGEERGRPEHVDLPPPSQVSITEMGESAVRSNC